MTVYLYSVIKIIMAVYNVKTKGVMKMYGCMKFRKLFRILVCDAVIIAIALILTFTSRDKWEAYSEKEIFLPVIMYHSITDDYSKVNDYTVTVKQIENDLEYLDRHGYNTVVTEDLISYINGGALPENPVIITSDDGFYNNACYLLPLLEKYDMKAVISVVGYYSEVLAENDPHIPEYSYLTWEDITALSNSGHIEIANHTYNMHFDNGRKGCSRLFGESYDDYADALFADIGLCQTLLSINCGISPAAFTYPYGAVSKESIPILKSMGFSAAYSCYEKPNYITRDPECLFTLDRYNRSGLTSTEEFMSRLLMQ